ncbi:MAG: amino acid permease [Lentisphaerae bacterium]|nr:amino acid permease [Lentisphaerota bacterium]
MDNSNKKLGALALSALVVSAMIGGGIFSLPQNMAQSAGLTAILIAWIITGVGMFFLANTFRSLAEAKPDAAAGIYMYARLGFGRFAGFQMAWAYYLSNVFGNVGYAVLLMDALNYFFPGTFTGGNNIYSIIGGSVVIWVMCFLVMRGTRQASSINIIGTAAKLIPIVLFILVMLAVFRWGSFSAAFSEKVAGSSSGSLMGQVKSTMLVTLWAFIGIEGAVVVSGRARNQRAVGLATVIGFAVCLTIYVLLSVTPFGRMSQSELANLSNPSTAPILSSVVGSWGGWVMNLGVIIALLTSWLAFTIMVVEIPYQAAKDGTFPRIFAHENAHGAPDTSLWITSLLMQLAMIFVYFANNAWNTMLSITAVMILPPYLASTAYLWKLCARRQFPRGLSVSRVFGMLCGVLGTVYALWMIYAAGLNYLAMAFWFMAIGIVVFIWARSESRRRNDRTDIPERYFSTPELIAVVLILAIALAALVWQTGEVKPLERTLHKWSQQVDTNIEQFEEQEAGL